MAAFSIQDLDIEQISFKNFMQILLFSSKSFYLAPSFP